MDKLQQKAIDFITNNTYELVVKKSICIYLLKHMSEIRQSMTIDSGTVELLGLNIYHQIKIKDAYFAELCKTDKVKKQLFWTVSDIIKKKDDICSEVLKQYGIDKGSQSTYTHDSLCKVFDRIIIKIKEAININDFNYLNSDQI